MRGMLVACALLALGGCSTLSTQGIDPAVANATMTAVQAAAGIAAADCNSPAPAVVCTPVPSTATPQQAQAALQACIATTVESVAISTVQKRLCARLGVAVPAAAK